MRLGRGSRLPDRIFWQRRCSRRQRRWRRLGREALGICRILRMFRSWIRMRSRSLRVWSLGIVRFFRIDGRGRFPMRLCHEILLLCGSKSSSLRIWNMLEMLGFCVERGGGIYLIGRSLSCNHSLSCNAEIGCSEVAIRYLSELLSFSSSTTLYNSSSNCSNCAVLAI